MLTIKITNNTTNQSVQYVRYNVDYTNGTYDVDGSINESGLLAITPTMPQTTTTTQQPEGHQDADDDNNNAGDD